MQKKTNGKWRVQKRPSPGTAPEQITVQPDAYKTKVSVISYSKESIKEYDFEISKLESILNDSTTISWINIVGLADKEKILSIANLLKLHPLALEDIYHSFQRPKVEPYDEHLFFTSRLFHLKEKLSFEQISFFVGKNFVVTVQEHDDDSFDPIRVRLRNSRGHVRSKKADYLAYCLIDTIVDSYFPILEHFGEELEVLEEQILHNPKPAHIARLHDIKSSLIRIRRAIWPQRDSLQQLLREDSLFIDPSNHIYFRDAVDHATQVIDLLENFREMSTSLLEVHLSTTSNKLNEVMKVLTIISTIFIPLSFIAGLYGMNFNSEVSKWNMPELQWQWGYPAVLLSMFLLTLGMLVFFWRKGWIFKGKT